jgi:ferredoxin/flavodoxin---NADP+ reductase
VAALGTADKPIQVAVVGSGPSGFYATEALLKCNRAVHVDMIERLPVPFGLVRNGVAPDHPKLKEPILVYDRIARLPGFAFFGNVEVGHAVSVAELREFYHAIVLACGAAADRKLNIPGETLPGSHTATEFVGWYNGHPDYRDRGFDVSHEVAVIIGQGNVAADICRILAKPLEDLARTDIAEHALEALAQSRIRKIHVVGRRGPAQAKFTSKELKELGEIPGCDALADPADLELNPASEQELADKMNREGPKNLELFRSFSARRATQPKRIFFHFLQSPIALEGQGRVERVVLARNRLEGAPFKQATVDIGLRGALECGLLFRSVGYKGIPIPDVPFDERRGIFPNRDGRIVERDTIKLGLYATGWIKRGPSGVIGTNRADSVATVQSLVNDLDRFEQVAKPGATGLRRLLDKRGVRIVSYADWLAIDQAELARGAACGKPREKFTRREEMLSAIPQPGNVPSTVANRFAGEIDSGTTLRAEAGRIATPEVQAALERFLPKL